MSDDTHQDDELKDAEGPLDAQEGDMDELQQKIAEAQQKDAEETEVMNELEQALQAQKEAEDRAIRALAELKNAQQRMENEKNQFAAFATQSLVLKVLEIYENYHRLLEHEPEGLDPEWKKGFELVDQQFKAFLDQQGVTTIAVQAGDKIDPERHEAMMTGEGPEGEILEVFSPGYEMKGRVIKTAKVKVGKA